MMRTPLEMDALRVRALQGDDLAELADTQREWVWRSLLKGVRRAELLLTLDMKLRQYEKALVPIRQRYQARLAAYKTNHAL